MSENQTGGGQENPEEEDGEGGQSKNDGNERKTQLKKGNKATKTNNLIKTFQLPIPVLSLQKCPIQAVFNVKEVSLGLSIIPNIRVIQKETLQFLETA